MNDILIIFALEAETQEHFGDLNLVHCGIGKVNAAYRLAQAVGQWRQKHGQAPRMVMNLGSAGSTHFNHGMVINCTSFIQRDFDTTALGFAPFATPFEDIPTVLENGLRFHDWQEGICGTGDSFVTDAGPRRPWNVIDMEAYALAKVCALENIPFGCLKYITDGADGQATISWAENVVNTSKVLRNALEKIAAK